MLFCNLPNVYEDEGVAVVAVTFVAGILPGHPSGGSGSTHPPLTSKTGGPPKLAVNNIHNGSSFSSVQYYKKMVEENLSFSTGTQVKSVYRYCSL